MEKIIQKFGENHRKDIPVHVGTITHIYTYKGSVFIIKEGRDLEWNEISEKEQKNIIKYLDL